MKKLTVLAIAAVFSLGLAGGAIINDLTAPPAQIVVHCPYIAGFSCTETIEGQTVTWPTGTTIVR